MDVAVLLLDELKYELEIRNLSVQGKTSALRKRLEVAISNAQPVSSLLECSSEELELVEKKLAELEVSLKQAKSKRRQSLVKYKSRLHYLPERFGRFLSFKISLNERTSQAILGKMMDLEESLETSGDGDEEEDVGSETETDVVEPLNQAIAKKTVTRKKLAKPSETVVLDEVVLNDDKASGRNSATPETIAKEDRVDSRKSVPVYKWGISFSGEGNVSAATFISNVEELRQARGISEVELFRSISELLTGKALTWHRAAKHSLFSWHDFKRRFLKVFLPPTYQEDLEFEIR